MITINIGILSLHFLDKKYLVCISNSTGHIYIRQGWANFHVMNEAVNVLALKAIPTVSVATTELSCFCIKQP